VNQPELLRFALDRQIRKLGCTRRLEGGRAVATWSEVVGLQIAAHSRAESLVNGSLTVVVPEATWRQELTLQKEDLIRRLNAALERNSVRDIHFVAVSRRKDH
jgi:predicted nucleic acid-binding Zn ribbon protein